MAHIVFQREPTQPAVRPRRFPGLPIQRRPDRREHAEQLKRQTDASAAKLERLRTSLGVVPGRLMVLRLDTIDVNQRDTLEERFNVSVVEELEERRDGRAINRLLVQFPDEQSLAAFRAEYDSYAGDVNIRTALPYGARRDLFDSLEDVSTVNSEERTGGRLQRDGRPAEQSFLLDVDLWNPNLDADYRQMFDSFRGFVESRGGQVVKDPLRIPSLVLVKVRANQQLLDDLLELDLVSLVDLPPAPPPEDSFNLFAPIQIPDPLPPVPVNGPKACLVDSGVVAGHPLLRGVVVDEEDFDSGENTYVDQNGHGTQVGGLVVYGNIAQRMQGNEWRPQVNLYSAKVMKNVADPIDPSQGEASFHDEERVEDQLRRAIEYFHREHGCRVFNLSIGHRDRVYTGGRQFPWAELLDELVRRLDIVIIVSAGNVPDPAIPQTAKTSHGFQVAVVDSLRQPEHRLIDPATAALCVSVGAIARRDDPYPRPYVTPLAATPQGSPSPFTRRGPGVAGAVKPEVVAPGGNFAVDSLFGAPRWVREDPNLGEPTLNRDFISGRQLSAVCGTSFAAGQVTHIAARMETALRDQLGSVPTQNLVRALLVNSARPHNNAKDYVGDKQADLLNAVGYGQPDIQYCWSMPNRVSLVAEDTVEHRTFHVYSLVVPKSFLEERGRRSISVSLAYDPPTRLSRRDYIATAMWLEVFGGLTTEQVFEYRSKYSGDGEPPTVPDRNKLDFKPGGQTIRMSTVQKRTWQSNRGTKFLNRQTDDGDATLHIFVGCQPRFQNPLGEDKQRYALVVTLQHSSQNINVYQQVQSRVRPRAAIRVTT